MSMFVELEAWNINKYEVLTYLTKQKFNRIIFVPTSSAVNFTAWYYSNICLFLRISDCLCNWFCKSILEYNCCLISIKHKIERFNILQWIIRVNFGFISSLSFSGKWCLTLCLQGWTLQKLLYDRFPN